MKVLCFEFDDGTSAEIWTDGTQKFRREVEARIKAGKTTAGRAVYKEVPQDQRVNDRKGE